MNSIRTLWLIIGILAALNLATLASLWLTRNPDAELPVSQREMRDRPYLERRLNFNERQSEAYRNLRQVHFQRAREIYRQIREQKEKLYSAIGERDTSYAEIPHTIGELHAELEELTFEHFREVRSLADSEQQRQMDSLMQHAIDRALPGMGRGRGPHGPGRRFRDQPVD